MTNSTLLRTLDKIDRALRIAEADRLAQIRAHRIANANPFANVIGTDWDQTPILDPSAPDLCENR